MSAGELVLVATPIGNLGDLSPRAAAALAEADAVCCEDTRHTGQLLSRLGLRARRLISLHAHNERERTAEMLGLLEGGCRVALVSDAGTPLVSDPGERLVRGAIEAGHRVTAVPGPSAVLAALVVSGLDTSRWCFEGFLPRRGAERSARLAALAAADCPSVVYESPQRLAGTLEDLRERCGAAREVAVCRELTKLYEETWRGTLGEAAARAREVPARGEHVLVLDGRAAAVAPDDEIVARAVNERIAAGAKRRDAAAEVALELGVSKRAAYQSSLAGGRRPGDRRPGDR